MPGGPGSAPRPERSLGDAALGCRRLRCIETMHPDGPGGAMAVLGSGVGVERSGSAPPGGRRVRFVIMAPTAVEAWSRRWVRQATATVLGRLAEDGVVYVLGGPVARLRLIRRLQHEGMRIKHFALHRDRGTASALVTLDRRSLRFAAVHVSGRPGLRGHVIRGVVRIPGCASVAAALARSVGVVLGGGRSRAAARWPPGPHSVAPALVTANDRTTLLWLAGDGGRAPDLIVKTHGGQGDDRLRQEADALSRFGPDARRSGAAVPQGRIAETGGGRSGLIMTALPGVPAATLLAARPSALGDVLETVLGWLHRWNARTAAPAVLDLGSLNRMVIEPGDRLAGHMPDGADYRAALARLCDRCAGLRVPFVAVHNDLTMGNVLLNDAHGPGVVDWESAQERGLPLLDFFYAAADAVAATGGYGDRVRAFHEAFGGAGTTRALIADREMRIRTDLGISGDLRELAFQACWLQHADDEHRAGRRSGRPFDELARDAANRLLSAGAPA